ncbi:MAG TPA: M48 family metalloprotease [Phycisphaerales bacterium]|nr:M48 family metalloprotease [Phycisphaerales bacterium]
MARFANNVKTALLMGGLMGLFLAVGSMYGQNGMIFALAFGGLANIIAWFFSDKIAIMAMQGQEVGPDEGGIHGELYRMVDELRQNAGMPMPRVYVCPHQAPNAFATGRSPKKAAVAVTEGALEILSLEELRGVMAHELAHVKNRDTLTSAIAATIAGVLAYIAQWGMLFGGGRDRETNPIVMFVTFIVAALGAAVIKSMISRSREFVADHDGAVIAGTPRGLMGALLKLDAYSQRIPLQNPNPAQNSMFIVEPLTGGSSILNLFASHPPTEKRVEALRKLEAEMRGVAPQYGLV